MLEDESAYGKILMVHVNGKLYEWTPPKGNLRQSSAGRASGEGWRHLLHMILLQLTCDVERTYMCLSEASYGKKRTIDRCCIVAAGASQEASVGAHGDLARWASGSVPSKRSKLQVHRLSSDFRAATHIVSEPLPAPNAIPPGHILVRRAYAGSASNLPCLNWNSYNLVHPNFSNIMCCTNTQ